jgi:hypothetical protein
MFIVPLDLVKALGTEKGHFGDMADDAVALFFSGIIQSHSPSLYKLVIIMPNLQHCFNF